MERKTKAALPLWPLVALLLIGLAFVPNPAAHPIICPEEDSLNCVWMGPLQGNGKGAVVLNFGEGQWLALPFTGGE